MMRGFVRETYAPAVARQPALCARPARSLGREAVEWCTLVRYPFLVGALTPAGAGACVAWPGEARS